MANEGPTGGDNVDTATLSKFNRFGANNPQGSAAHRAQQGSKKKNQLMMMLLQMMMEEEEPEEKATKTYQEELAGDKESTLTPALANNPATALMGPQKPKEEPKDNFKNMLLALLLKSQG
jgi:uncharacterized protein YecA (UPF0149 family)